MQARIRSRCLTAVALVAISFVSGAAAEDDCSRILETQVVDNVFTTTYSSLHSSVRRHMKHASRGFDSYKYNRDSGGGVIIPVQDQLVNLHWQDGKGEEKARGWAEATEGSSAAEFDAEFFIAHTRVGISDQARDIYVDAYNDCKTLVSRGLQTRVKWDGELAMVLIRHTSPWDIDVRFTSMPDPVKFEGLRLGRSADMEDYKGMSITGVERGIPVEFAEDGDRRGRISIRTRPRNAPPGEYHTSFVNVIHPEYRPGQEAQDEVAHLAIAGMMMHIVALDNYCHVLTHLAGGMDDSVPKPAWNPTDAVWARQEARQRADTLIARYGEVAFAKHAATYMTTFENVHAYWERHPKVGSRLAVARDMRSKMRPGGDSQTKLSARRGELRGVDHPASLRIVRAAEYMERASIEILELVIEHEGGRVSENDPRLKIALDSLNAAKRELGSAFE